MENNVTAPQNIKNRITVWSSNSTSEHKSKELKAGTQTDICTHVFIAAFFTLAERWKQARMSITKTKRSYVGLTGRESTCRHTLILHTWVTLPGYIAHERTSPCDVRAAPPEVLFLFLRKVDLRKVNNTVPKVTLQASSTSGPLHQSNPWQDLLSLHKWIPDPTFQQDKSTILEPAPQLPPHPTAPGCLRAQVWAPSVIQQIPTSYLFYIMLVCGRNQHNIVKQWSSK